MRLDNIVDLNNIYKTKEEQLIFVANAILTFRLDLKTISRLIGCDSKKLYGDLIAQPFMRLRAIDLIFKGVYKNDQKISERQFINFYKDYLNAKQKHDLGKIDDLNRIIYDIDAQELIDTRKSGDHFSTNDALIFIKYQLKYLLTNDFMLRLFKVHNRTKQKAVDKLFLERSDLNYLKDELNELNKYLFNNYRRRGRKK